MESPDAIAESVGMILWEARLPDFAFTRISRTVETLFGYPRARWEESGFWASILHPEDREDAVAFCLAQSMAGHPHEFEYRVIAADGSVLWVRDIVVSVEEGEHGPRLCGLMMDISGRRAETLARHRAGGLDLPEGWGQTTLVRSFAEDLRGPLAGFLAAAEAAPAAGQPPAALAAQARALLGIVEAGLAGGADPGAAEDGADRPACEAVLLGDLVAEAARGLGAGIAPAVETVLDPALAAPVVIHAPSLRRILFLLMLNAARHPPGRGRRIAIAVQGERLRIACGAEAGEAAAVRPERVLELAAGRRRARDQALMLAHVATLAEGLGGTLGLRAAPGRLAEIELYLPFEWAEAQTADSPPRLRVLYAEDDVINAQVMSELLKLQGIETEIAINGRDAVEMFGEDEFDLVLMDIRMPLMDGIEATRRIRADEAQARRRRTPIIGISAHAMAEDVARCLAAGMDAHIAKPVRLEVLTEMIERFVPRLRLA